VVRTHQLSRKRYGSWDVCRNRRPQATKAEIQGLNEELNNVSAERTTNVGRPRKRCVKAQADLAHINRLTAMGSWEPRLPMKSTNRLAAIVNNADACLNCSLLTTWRRPESLPALVVKDDYRAAEIIDRIRALIKKAPPRKDPLGINEAIV